MADGIKIGWNESSLNSLKQQLKDQVDKITQEKVELGVEIKDDAAIKQLNSILDAVRNVQDTAGKAIDIQVNASKSKEELAGIKGNFEDIINTYKQLGQISVSPSFDKNGMIKDFTIQLQQLNGLIDKVKYNVNEFVDGKDKMTPISFKVDSIKEINELDKTIEKVEDFKNKYSNAVKELKGIKVDAIFDFQKQLDSLNINNFKEKTDQIKNIYSNLLNEQKQYNEGIKQQEQLNSFVNTQQNKLNNIKSGYSNKLDTGSSQYNGLENTYKKLTEELNTYQTQEKKLSSEETNDIKNRINDFNKEKSSIIDITNTIKQQENALEGLKNKFGSIIPTSKINEIKTELKGLYTSTNLTGDTNKITQEIEKVKELATQVQRVKSFGGNAGTFSGTGINMSSSIQEIEQFIQKTVSAKASVDNIKESMDSLGNKLRTVNYTISEGNGVVSKHKLTIDEDTKGIYNLTTGLQNVNEKNNSFSSSLGNAVKNLALYSAGAGLAYESLNQIKEGIQEVEDVNKSNVNIAMITGDSIANVQKNNDALLDMAKNLKVANSEVLNGQEAWMRSGVSMQEANKDLETTTKLSKIAGVENKEMADSLIVIKNAYGLGADELKNYASKVALLDNTSATSSQKINSAMQYSAQTFKSVGIDMNTALSWITNYSEKSAESGEAIGNHFKSLLENFHKLKAGYKEGNDEDLQSVNKIEGILNAHGISLRKTKDQWQDLGTVVKEIQQNIDKFSDVDKSNLAFKIGGKENAEATLATLNNLKEINQFQDKLKSDNGGKALDTSYEKYKQGIEAQLANLKNSITSFWMHVIDEKKVEGAVSEVTKLVKTLEVLATTEKSSGVELAALGTAFILITKNIGMLTSSFTKMGAMVELFTVIQNGVGTTAALSGAFAALGASIKATLLAVATNPLTWIITGFGLATAAVIEHVQHQADLKQETDDLKKSYQDLTQAMKDNNAEGIKSSKTDLEKQQKNFQDLISNQKEAKEKLDKAMNNLNSDPTNMLNQTNAQTAQLAYDNITKAVNEQKEAMDKAGISATTLANAQNELNNINMLKGIQDETKAKQDKNDETIKEIQEYQQLNEVGEKNSTQKERMTQLSNDLANSIQGLIVSKDKDGNVTITNTGLLSKNVDMLNTENKQMKTTANAAMEAAKQKMQWQENDTTYTYEQIAARIKMYQAEEDKLKEEYNNTTNKQDKRDLADRRQATGFAEARDNDTLATLDSIFNSVTKNTDATKGLDNAEKGYTTDLDGNTSKTKKNTEAQKAQKEAIDKVKEATKEYETELKNLDNIQTQLELNMTHMDDTSQKYRDSIMEEISLLQQKNGFLQKGVDLNNSQAGTLGGYSSSGGSQLGQEIVNTAESYLGTPYAYGGESPNGFDCSGLVQYVYNKVGIALNRTSEEQFSQGTEVSKSDLQPGDLVFFEPDGSGSPGHVAIYAGGGEIIAAPHTGDVVKTQSLDDVSNADGYVGARRIVGSSSDSSGSSSSSTETQPTSMTYGEMVDAAGSKYGIDPNLIAAVIEQESSWKATEKSSAGAVGLMQLMPETAESEGLSADQRTDPLKNIMAGTKYLSELVSKYGEEKGVALYNTGEYGGGNSSYASSVESKKAAYASGSSSMPTTSADVTSDTDVLSELDTLNSKTEDYQKKMMSNASTILDWYNKWYESYLKYYDLQASNVDKQLNLDKENYTYFEKDSNSLNDSSRQYMQKEYEDINAKNAILLQKQEFIENQLKINSGTYDEKTVAQMKEDLTSVQTEIKKNLNDLHQAFKDWIADQVTYKTQGYKDNIDNYNSQLSLLNEKDSGSSEAKVNLNEQILDQRRQVSNGIQSEIAKVQDLYMKEAYGVTRQLWAEQLKELKKQLIENETEIEKSINTLRDAKISEILDDTDKRLKLINDDLKNIDRNSKDVGDNNTSQKLIDEMNKASDYVTQLKEYVASYNDIYNAVSADGVISTDDQKKIDDARSKIDSVNDSLQTTKLDIDSLKLDNVIAQYSQAIDRITNSFSKLDFQLNMLSSNNYTDKANILNNQYGLNNTKISNLMSEYNELMNQSATKGTKEAENLANKYADVRDKLMEAAKEGKTLKEELIDANLSATFQQIENPKNKINQLESNIEFQTSMPSNVQGLLLGNNLNYDTKSDNEKELEDTENISNVVDDINDKIADLQAGTYDIDTSNIESTIESTTGTTNDILKNINDSVNKINEANNKSVEKKSVFGSGADLDSAKFAAEKYGISGLFNFIDTNKSEYLMNKDKYPITSNDIILGGTGAVGGISDTNTEGKRIAGSDRDATKNLIDDYMKSLTDLLKNSSNSNSDKDTVKANEELVKKLDLENTNSSTIVTNTGKDVTEVQIQTTSLVKSEDDVAKSVNNNINSNFVTMEELTRNVKDVLGSIKDAINSLKDLEDKDLGQIITDLDVIDTKTIIEELTKLHESVNNLGDTLSTGLSTEDKRVPFTPVDAVAMPDYNKDDKNKNQNNKEVNKNGHGNSKLDPSILGDGEGSNKGAELVINKETGETKLIGSNGYTLVPDLTEDDIVVSHEDTEKILSQGGIQKISKYADGKKKIKVYAKSGGNSGDGDLELAQKYASTLNRSDVDIDVHNIFDESDPISSGDYVLGTELTIPNALTNGAKRIDGGAGRSDTLSNFEKWIDHLDIKADSSDVKTTENNNTKPDTTNTKTTGDYNSTSGDSGSSSTTTDYTKLEDTDYRKQLNKEIAESENTYNNQLATGASNSDLLQTEIDLEKKKILLNQDGITQLEQKKKLAGLTSDNLAKINSEQISINKEIQESQKKINELAKDQVDATVSVNDAKEKQLETDIKLVGSTSTKDELENDKRKAEILKDETKEYENQQDSLKDLKEKNNTYLSDLNGFSSDKLSTDENSQLKDLILKQNKDGYLNAEDQAKLKSIEAKLTKADPDKSLSLQKIIDLLASSKDKISDTQVTVQTLKEKVDDEEYTTALQVIQNEKSLDEAQFAQNKKDWAKQIFNVSEGDFNSYKARKTTSLEKEKAEAQEKLKSANGDEVSYYQDEIVAKTNAIADLQKQSYSDIYDWQNEFSKIHEFNIQELEEENKLTQEKEASLERQNSLLEKEKELNDALNNKNVQVMTKNANGEWQYSYEADQTKVQSLQKEISEQMKSNNDADREQKIEDEKQYENDLINTAKDGYDKLVNDQQHILDEKYSDMNFLVESYLRQVRDAAGGSHEKVQKALDIALTDSQTKLDKFITYVDGQVDDMVKNLNNLVTNTKKNVSQDDTSSVVSGISDVASGKATPQEIQQLNDILNSPNASDELKQLRTDLFDSTKADEVKQIIGKYLPEGTNVDTWLKDINSQYANNTTKNSSNSVTESSSNNLNTNPQNTSKPQTMTKEEYMNSDFRKNLEKEAVDALNKNDTAKLAEIHKEAIEYMDAHGIAQAADGGQTPSWGDDGKLMYVHQNELISSEFDSKNILSAAEILQNMNSLNVNDAYSSFNPSNLYPNIQLQMPQVQTANNQPSQNIQQTFEVNADFSGIRTSQEVVDALDTISARGIQYASGLS